MLTKNYIRRGDNVHQKNYIRRGENVDQNIYIRLKIKPNSVRIRF